MTSALVDQFINGVELDRSSEIPALWVVHFNEEVNLRVEVLKQFVYVILTLSPRLKIVDYRGREIVTKIFETLSNYMVGDNTLKTKGHEILPTDFKAMFEIYDSLYYRYSAEEKNNEKEAANTNRHRVICDFIASMTNRYAIEFYGRVTSEQPETIFKGY